MSKIILSLLWALQTGVFRTGRLTEMMIGTHLCCSSFFPPTKFVFLHHLPADPCTSYHCC